MADYLRSLRTLGPFNVEDVDDDILGDVVYSQEAPIIVKQTVNDETKFAVIAKDRELRIVCAGCFKRNMSLADDSRCKKVCSFVKHWDRKNGDRCQKCKNVGDQAVEAKAENSDMVTMDFTNTNGTTVEAMETSDLIAELKRRDEQHQKG